MVTSMVSKQACPLHGSIDGAGGVAREVLALAEPFLAPASGPAEPPLASRP